MSFAGLVGSALGLPGGNNSALGTIDPSAGPGQSFFNLPLANTKTTLYTLSIRYPMGPSEPVPSYTYTFPLSPSSIGKSYTSLTTIYDVAGPAGAYSPGVQRVSDEYGSTFPTFTIEGTTGWQYHSIDGYMFTGNESIAALQQLFVTYASLNRTQQLSNNPNLYQLLFFDYFADEYWQIVPVGEQSIRQSQQRPLVFDYAFRFAAVANVASPPPPDVGDALDQQLAIAGEQAAAGLNVYFTNQINTLIADGAGALGILV